MTTTLHPTVEDVRAAAAAVADPELPVITLGMLGMVHTVEVDGARARIVLLPTFSGCPATEMMARDVTAAVTRLGGIDEVDVEFRFDPPWTSDLISEEGHRRLEEFGIAPPTGSATVSDVTPGQRRQLPVMTAAPADPRPCPYCGSDDTQRESAFGPTPCRDIRFCATCQQPFEAFKNL